MTEPTMNTFILEDKNGKLAIVRRPVNLSLPMSALAAAIIVFNLTKDVFTKVSKQVDQDLKRLYFLGQHAAGLIPEATSVKYHEDAKIPTIIGYEVVATGFYCGLFRREPTIPLPTTYAKVFASGVNKGELVGAGETDRRKHLKIGRSRITVPIIKCEYSKQDSRPTVLIMYRDVTYRYKLMNISGVVFSEKFGNKEYITLDFLTSEPTADLRYALLADYGNEWCINAIGIPEHWEPVFTLIELVTNRPVVRTKEHLELRKQMLPVLNDSNLGASLVF